MDASEGKMVTPDTTEAPDGRLDASDGKMVTPDTTEAPDGKAVSPDKTLDSKLVGKPLTLAEAETDTGTLTLGSPVGGRLLADELADTPGGNATQTFTAAGPPPDCVVLPPLGVVHSAGVLDARVFGSVFPQ
jgi:hypothetical protein